MSAGADAPMPPLVCDMRYQAAYSDFGVSVDQTTTAGATLFVVRCPAVFDRTGFRLNVSVLGLAPRA